MSRILNSVFCFLSSLDRACRDRSHVSPLLRSKSYILHSAMLAILFCLSSCSAAQQTLKPITFRGTSDASAAVALTDDLILVADDENNILRVYRTTGPDLPVFSYDLTEFLETDSDHPEADIEGATRIGDRIYWITSHGRNKDGGLRPSRYRFFATDIKIVDNTISLQPVGKPHKMLVQSLLNNPAMRRLGLREATRLDDDLSKKQREQLAPKDKGLNIEALAASPDGNTLFIGFRNPLPLDKTTGRACALVIPLTNPQQVVEKGASPAFAEPILWDMNDLGLRSMEYSGFHKAFFIIAGRADETPDFALYRWSGKTDEKPALLKRMSQSDLTPEALIPFEKSEKLLLLSDDGSLLIKVAGPHECLKGEYRKDGSCENKALLDPNRKTFRALRLTP